MVDFDPTMSIIILNISGLNVTIKRASYMLSIKKKPLLNITHRLKEWKKDMPCES